MMLYVLFGSVNSHTAKDWYVPDSNDWFEALSTELWVKNNWAQEIIWEIDWSKRLGFDRFASIDMGEFSRSQLSSGVKMLILMREMEGLFYNGNGLGQNCFKYLFDLSSEKDICINLTYYIEPVYLSEDIVCTDLLSGEIISSREEFYKCWFNSDMSIYYNLEALTMPYEMRRPFPWMLED